MNSSLDVLQTRMTDIFNALHAKLNETSNRVRKMLAQLTALLGSLGFLEGSKGHDFLEFIIRLCALPSCDQRGLTSNDLLTYLTSGMLLRCNNIKLSKIWIIINLKLPIYNLNVRLPKCLFWSVFQFWTICAAKISGLVKKGFKIVTKFDFFGKRLFLFGSYYRNIFSQTLLLAHHSNIPQNLDMSNYSVVTNSTLKEMCDNILMLMTKEAMEAILWPHLIDFLLAPEYINAVPSVIKSLSQLAIKMRQNKSKPIEYSQFKHVQGPYVLYARLLVLAAAPPNLALDGLNVLTFMQNFAPHINKHLSGK